ncbi:helix-turn-helix domain-containing protein [Boseongicola sp. H5]|uniref:helix-turn-helix domain-containing protein n=1 Tax=Boseongicola sp. H5 TaxID=2763261 RepID=UPI00336A3E48
MKAAKRKGVYRGRPPKIDMAAIQTKLGAGLSPSEIAREMGISRGTVYKAKAQMLTGNEIIEGPIA